MQGDLLEPVTFPLHMAAVRARNNALSETTTQSDFLDDSISGGVAMNADETTCYEVADMFQACKEAAAKWGGVCSPTKTEVLMPAGLQGARKARHDELMARLSDINGAPVRVLRADNVDVKRRGMDVLGVPVGPAEHAVHAWEEALDKKRMRPEVYNRLTAQEQQSLILYTEQRYNHKCRGDLCTDATRHVRAQIDDYYFGPEGIVYKGPLRMNPAELSVERRERLQLRMHMLGIHGGLGLRPLAEDGEYAHLSMIAEMVRSNGDLVPQRGWLIEQLQAGDAATSDIAKYVVANIAKFEAEVREVLPEMEALRHLLPLTVGAVIGGERMPQSAIRVAQSLQRNHTWEALAPPEELRRRKHVKKCDWRVLATGVPTSRQLVMPDSAFPDALKFQLSVAPAPIGEVPRCVCNKPLTAAHAMRCRQTGATGRIHTRLRNVLKDAAKFCGLQPDALEPRLQPNSNNSQGGADIRMTRVRDDGFTVAGVPAIDDTQRTTLVLDVTTTSVDAKSNREDADLEPAGYIVQRLEKKKLTASSDAAVARINGSQYIACGLERDTLAFGEGLDEVIQRFAFQRRGHEYEGREDLLQGHVDGLWSAPSAEKYWRKVVVTQVVIARQAEVTRAYGAYQAG